MGRGKTISRLLFEDAKAFFQKYSNDITRQAYVRNYRKYITYCREQHQCKTKEECSHHITEYSAHLQSLNLSPSTIHTYLAPVCIYHSVNLKQIEKPKRKTSEYTRGRSFNKKKNRSDNDLSNKKYTRTVEFALRTGIRRAEIARIRGGDLVKDESGHLCIKIRRGKGGKKQLQLILPDNESFIKNYFENKAPDKPIFDQSELKNKIPYHYLRAKHAQEAYKYFESVCSTQEGRQQLESDMRNRWNKYNINPRTGKPKKFNKKLIEGIYFLRGDNKKFAIENNLPTKFEKLPLLATSIFVLAHWRNDVSVESYLLAI